MGDFYVLFFLIFRFMLMGEIFHGFQALHHFPFGPGPLPLFLEPGNQLRRLLLQLIPSHVPLVQAVVGPLPQEGIQDGNHRNHQEHTKNSHELSTNADGKQHPHIIRKYGVEIIAIGNGTAGRETERFAAEVIAEIDEPVSYMVVSEAGASVYSASKLAAEEFPDYDVNLRSAVSIARRLQDPLAELVKIDPKAVGVGQYQHDMPAARLSAELDGVVERCVNTVGVDLNTASAPLLSRVAGLTQTTAKNVVAYREENGEFTSRRQLLKVSKLGPKAFEQCAGFLRVPTGITQKQTKISKLT